jgi:hypothetical protein
MFLEQHEAVVVIQFRSANGKTLNLHPKFKIELKSKKHLK